MTSDVRRVSPGPSASARSFFTAEERNGLVVSVLVFLMTLATIFVLAGCNGATDKEIVFPHEKHTALGAACKDCHEPGKLPTQEVCVTCHDVTADTTVTTAMMEKFLAARVRKPGAVSLTFAHDRHTSLECADCHAIKEGKMTRPAMATCMDACHGEKAGAPLACSSCHAELDGQGKPQTHTAEWRNQHGPVAKQRDGSCITYCHKEETCFTCHRTSKPRDHNQQWRLRGHGVIAQANRERCVSCHRSEECTRCHLGTQPINHTTSWKRNATTHCRQCHLPLSQNSCAACHLSAPHAGAPAWLNGGAVPHVSGNDCRTCHIGPGQRLEHPDNGDNCESCHAK